MIQVFWDVTLHMKALQSCKTSATIALTTRNNLRTAAIDFSEIQVTMHQTAGCRHNECRGDKHTGSVAAAS